MCHWYVRPTARNKQTLASTASQRRPATRAVQNGACSQYTSFAFKPSDAACTKASRSASTNSSDATPTMPSAAASNKASAMTSTKSCASASKFRIKKKMELPERASHHQILIFFIHHQRHRATTVRSMNGWANPKPQNRKRMARTAYHHSYFAAGFKALVHDVVSTNT